MKRTNSSNTITFFPVGNGDMTLIKLKTGLTFLIDCYLQEEMSDNRSTIAKDLIDLLPLDDSGRPYVDYFLLTHPDQDHCYGAKEFIHLDEPEKYDFDSNRKKIFIRELWSAPLIFRRLNQKLEKGLCSDAQAIKAEAKRRVTAYKKNEKHSNVGNKVKIIGSDLRDDQGKNRLDGLDDIRVKVGDEITIKHSGIVVLKIYIHSPINPSDDNHDINEEKWSKNNSSVISQWTIYSFEDDNLCNNKILFGGDAEVDIWECIYDSAINNLETLEYDILLAPHHCSWKTLSHDAATDFSSEASEKAINALSQVREKPVIISSSKSIEDNINTPPALRAKTEYIKLVKNDKDFICLGEEPNIDNPRPYKIDLLHNGPKRPLPISTNSNNQKGVAHASRKHGQKN